MRKLVEGYRAFREQLPGDRQELYRQLAEGQAPEVLFITCCDSRVQPLDFTGTEPGDIFVERCLGNIIPDAEGGDPQLNAVIEYSVQALGVSHVVLCGHTGCGAMRGLLEPESVKSMPAVASWLENARETLDAVRSKHADLSGDDLLDATVRENVVVMLRRLSRVPVIASRLADGDLQLHGWVFDIERGRLIAHDASTGDFLDLREVEVDD